MPAKKTMRKIRGGKMQQQQQQQQMRRRWAVLDCEAPEGAAPAGDTLYASLPILTTLLPMAFASSAQLAVGSLLSHYSKFSQVL